MIIKSGGRRLLLPLFICFLAAAGPIGCQTTTQTVSLTDPAYSARPAMGGETTFGLDYRDFEYAAKQAVDSFLNSPRSIKPGSNAPWIMAISRIVNDTTLVLDTDQLVKKIRIALLNSGRVITTTAVGAGGPEDRMSAQVRELRGSKLFNQKTVARSGTMVAPDLSLSGKIMQRIIKVGGKQQVDYYFQLAATDIRTGLAYWEFEKVIAKLGDNTNFSWGS